MKLENSGRVAQLIGALFWAPKGGGFNYESGHITFRHFQEATG